MNARRARAGARVHECVRARVWVPPVMPTSRMQSFLFPVLLLFTPIPVPEGAPVGAQDIITCAVFFPWYRSYCP
eukprot:2777601-Pyramimonas_sp.AAC.1